MSAIPGEFFTLASFGTLAGLTGITHVVRSVWVALGRSSSPVVAFIIALLATEGGVYLTGTAHGADYVVGVLNACLVFLTAGGSTQLVHQVIPDPIRPHGAKRTFGNLFLHSPFWSN